MVYFGLIMIYFIMGDKSKPSIKEVMMAHIHCA